MAEEPEILELLRRLAASQEAMHTELTAVKADQSEMRASQAEMRDAQTEMRAAQAEMRAAQTEMRAAQAATNAKLDRLDARTDRMLAKLDRAAVRADDVMGAQVRMQSDIAAIRATLEDGGREIADAFREDFEDLRERVAALEKGR